MRWLGTGRIARMKIVADVHGAASALRTVAAGGGPLVILGDLINFIDYRNLDGIVADVCGRAFVADLVALRTAGDVGGARRLWEEFAAGREAELRAAHDAGVEAQYREVCGALDGVDSYVTFGNADRPERLRAHLPGSARFVDGDVVDIGGRRVGFAGGGLQLSGGFRVPGEVTEEDLAAKLAKLGPVDVLCTHVPPAVAPLQMDVVGGRLKGSEAVLGYLRRHRPRFHYFGDIHQPQALRWRVDQTLCVNAGYFRATGRALDHADMERAA